MILLPRWSTLFPYTTLFRSARPRPSARRRRSRPPARPPRRRRARAAACGAGRSEEHTSELQSHVNLVCRLLLEKKNPSRSSRYVKQFLRFLLLSLQMTFYVG